jgi:hypothetical protein
VGDVERIRDRVEEPEDLGRRQRTPGSHDLGEIRSVEIAHRQVQLALPLAGGVDRHDVRMLERGESIDLAEEPLPVGGVGGEGRGDELEGDPATRARFARKVDDAHTPTGENGVHLVAGEEAAGRERRDHETSCDPRADRPGEYATERRHGRPATDPGRLLRPSGPTPRRSAARSRPG